MHFIKSKQFYFIESSDEGSEIMLKLRLSSNCQDIKMPLMTRDTIAQAKKKLQVSIKLKFHQNSNSFTTNSYN